MKTRWFLPILTVVALSCSGDGDGSAGIPDLDIGDKADNFYSSVASEYEVTGTVVLDLTEEELADEALRDDYITRRLTAVGLYLTTYMTDKFRGIDINGDGEITDDEVFFHNEDYGGFHAMVRNFTVEPLEVADDGEGNATVTFTIDLAGPKDLLEQMANVPGVTVTTTTVRFGLQMPLGEAVDPQGVPRGEIRRFDPADYDGELETIDCEMTELLEPADAYPHFNEMMADALFDITMFYGHDYNVGRHDLVGAREAYDRLLQLGYQSPVGSFEELAADSGPFVRDISANGRAVRVEVRIFHSDMFIDDRPGQHDLAIDEIASRDVFFYNGHAGPYFGFYLDEAYAATVNYDEFADIDFEPDRQQLFIAQGCQTYSQYADMLYANPNKSEDNLDVIVTVNYSYSHGTLGLLENLIATDTDGRHQARRYYEIIGDLNREYINSWYNVFYGVTGIDGNPQLHPYANIETLGQECQAPADCGDLGGNICVSHEEQSRCAVFTLAADACPGGSIHGVIDVDWETRGVCFMPEPEPEPEPEPTPEAPGAGQVVITEIMANPDTRGDREAEWFEVTNIGETTVNLEGCQLGDDDGLTHTIEGELLIEPWQYIVLARSANTGFTPDYVYGGNNYIANHEDEVIIVCDETTIDRVAYVGGVRTGRSMSLSPDAIDAAANDTDQSWCAGEEVYAELGDRLDRGTPGDENPPCAE